MIDYYEIKSQPIALAIGKSIKCSHFCD